MKKYIVALTAGMILTACQQEANQSADSAEVKSEQTASTQALQEKDKIAYAIGTNMADSVLGINTEFKALTMDLDVVQQGFKDRIASQSKLTDEEIAEQFQIFQGKMQFAQQQKAEEAKATKMAENETYLTENLAKGFTKTESGLQYKVLTAAAEGAAMPTATDRVKVHYTGTFTDGTQFDSSVERGEPFEFSLSGGVIKGWLEGVKLMSVGSKVQFVIPPELGYGFSGRPGMPAGSILIFDVELLEILKPEATDSAK